MAQEIIDSPFVASCSLFYPGGDNNVDPTRTVEIRWNGMKQTLTFNADGKPLSASNLEKV